MIGLLVAAVVGACEGVNLEKHVPLPPYKVESKREVAGLCELILNFGGTLVPVYATKDFVISGELFINKKQVTQEALEKVKRKLVKDRLRKLDELSFIKAGKGKKYFYFITAPECPYCNAIKEKVRELAEKYGYEVRVVFYPFSEEGLKRVAGLYCSKGSYEDYVKENYGKPCPEGLKKVQEAKRALGFVQGTPTFIFPDGDVLVGADVKKLERKLKEE